MADTTADKDANKPKIDLNRGVECRFDQTGVQVYMYMDTPGVYLSAHGIPVPDSFAKKVGYPVKEYAVLRQKRELLAQAHAKIESQFGVSPDTREVLADVNGFQLIHVGHRYFNIFHPATDATLNPRPLPEDEAEALYKEFVPEWVKKPAVTATSGVAKVATAA